MAFVKHDTRIKRSLTYRKDNAAFSVRWHPKHELKAVLLCIRIPVRPIPVASIIRFVFNFASWDPEGDSFVWLCSNLGNMLHAFIDKTMKHVQ
jgi:hypothetical protein